MTPNFEIDNIFLKIDQDEELIKYLTSIGILYNDQYKYTVKKRILEIYEQDFDLYGFWLGDYVSNIFNFKVNIYPFLVTDFQSISNGTFRLELKIGDFEKYEEEYFNINFSSCNSLEKVVNVLNYAIKNNSTSVYVRDYVYFSLYNTQLFLNSLEIPNITDKLVLTLSNSSYVGIQLLSILQINEVTEITNSNTIDTFVNTKFSTYTGFPLPWDLNYSVYIASTTPEIYLTREYNNYELIEYVFNLDSIIQYPTAIELLTRRFLYHFKYMGIDWFFLQNYRLFLPQYDYEQIQTKDQLKVFLDSLMVQLDFFAEKIQEFSHLKDIDLIPTKLLDYLAYNFGYIKEDFNVNQLSFREILKNIIEIYKIKGTNYCIEIFFKFIGFKAYLEEFWFDKREFFNSGTNPYTFSSDINNFKHYMVKKKPIETPNNYQNYLSSKIIDKSSFNVLTELDIQATQNLFRFNDIMSDPNTIYEKKLNLLGMGGDTYSFDNTWSFNVNSAVVNTPKFPYVNGEVYTQEDLLNIIPDSFGARWHENDFSFFNTSSGSYSYTYKTQAGTDGTTLTIGHQDIFFDNNRLYLKNKNNLPNFVAIYDSTYEYFKTNYVKVTLVPFKKGLSPNDPTIIQKYIDYLIPIFVFTDTTVSILEDAPEAIGWFDEDDLHFTYTSYDFITHNTFQYDQSFRYDQAQLF